MLNITLNGDAISTDQSNVLALLESLELTQGRFAVEIDGSLVPKSRLADTPITQGMNIEVVQAVGGG
ncbi:thiamine biosynthesis protein ThiS [Moraxella bovoculi]|uniref:Thiamine biosynthesis protein ThiS n=1 Tax=Moraxella bovoculi 237 TaxID=743974 RepID=A0A066UFI8_9GAMM|nr:sulfur carrier protein ThiS [Moraxella bovoculi]AKG15714.2 thiamine biosynthesis protein ThiS [Moraxella bovoculi]AKG19148.1 thiamine biosynthesis protein ThiS [Moraxella bovoculi]KDN24637.1 thiamine biosynthesis protein ThiS [Moraxella bovoculi 237]NSM11551.1 sulfur carrier protein ThiS [Moraxella bovoculi]